MERTVSKRVFIHNPHDELVKIGTGEKRENRAVDVGIPPVVFRRQIQILGQCGDGAIDGFGRTASYQPTSDRPAVVGPRTKKMAGYVNGKHGSREAGPADPFAHGHLRSVEARRAVGGR